MHFSTVLATPHLLSPSLANHSSERTEKKGFHQQLRRGTPSHPSRLAFALAFPEEIDAVSLEMAALLPF
jgi:hypothetical protein